jgi:hypothetical protein
MDPADCRLTVAREKLFNMRMSSEEWERLEFLSQHYGLNAAGVIRMLVKGDFDRLHRALEDQTAQTTKAKRKR